MIDTTTSPRRSGMAEAMRRAALPLALLAILAGCNSTTPPATTNPVRAAEKPALRRIPQTSPEIRRIEMLGRTIYVLDNAASRATDLVLAEGAHLRADGIRGWVTDTSGSGVLVRLIRQSGDRFESAYDITVNQRGESAAMTMARPTNPRLTPDQSAQFAARQLVLAQSGSRRCPGHYNTVAFRDPGSSNWRIYLLAATTTPDVMMFLGHLRALVSADGRRVVSIENLSKTCQPPPGEIPEGAEIMGGMVTEIQSPTPIETHVFASLLYQRPLGVGTRDGKVWIVDQGRISELQ
ncbi:hypothetical protein [Inquilinus ginsengisoli]|uniref:hypothetical protein n=1 Tax=Inquilinus ginsengisoli TaxID=363840 RepID=UPI003D24002B